MLIKNNFAIRISFIALATTFTFVFFQPFKTKVNAQSVNLSAPYVGVWEGTGAQASSSWTISITLTPGAVNSVVGTIAYPSLSCGGNLTLRRIKAQSIELAEEFTYGNKQCVAGRVVLQQFSNEQLEYKWLFQDGRQGATGSVRKVGNNTETADSNTFASIKGTWQSDWGEVVFNSDLTGRWNQGGGRIGRIKDGKYDPRTRKLIFHYYQSWNDMYGTAIMKLSEDGNQLLGTWKQQRLSSSLGSGGSGSWTMTRNPS